MKHLKYYQIFEKLSNKNIYFYGGKNKNIIDDLDRIYYFSLDGEDVGSIELELIDNYIMLSCFEIKDDYKGFGYGKLFFKIILDSLKEKSKFISLIVSKNNIPALKIYREFGFVISEYVPEFKGKKPYESKNSLFLIKRN